MILSLPTSQRLLRAAVVVIFAAFPACLVAQSAGEHIALGDRDAAALNASSALRHYEDAIKVDVTSYEALWKATREAVDVGEYNPDEKERDRLYSQAELYARRAVEANPNDAEGHFQLARALGRIALSVGKRDRVQYATDVRAHALDALRVNPRHPGALHVMGMWNYNVMRLSGIARYMAKKFLGGNVFDAASWDDAQRYMEESVALEPNRLVHHLDLARVYVARDNREKAREQYEVTIHGAATSFNDRKFQAEAAEEIRDVR